MEHDSGPSSVESSRKRLLIVDDEPSILKLLNIFFQSSGYHIQLCDNGLEAKEILTKRECDLLITDKNLPDLSGMELLRIAKEYNPICEVIILTGYDSKETMIEAIDHSAYAYLLKAEALENIRGLQDRVRTALEKQDVIIENQRLLEHLSQSNAKLKQSLIERERLEERLVQSEKMAAVGHFVAGIYHELSAPINGIRTLADEISSSQDTEVMGNMAHDIMFHIEELEAVLQDMKSFSNREEAPERVHLHEVLKDCLEVFATSPLLKGTQIDMDVAQDLSLHIDSLEIKQIFVNLIKNALEAIDSAHSQDGNGRIFIRAYLSDSKIVVEIIDNGSGIKEKHIPMLFDPHFTTKKIGNVRMGLGLNVTYRLVLKHYGKISVHSEIGNGTTFRVVFPMLKSD